MPINALVIPSKMSAVTSIRHEIRSVGTLDAFHALRPQWSALADAAQECSPSMAFGYCELAAARVLADGGIVNVAMVFDDHELVALWPVAIIRKGALRVAQTLGCGSGEEYGGPLIRDAARSGILEAAMAAVMRVRADVLEVRMVEKDSSLQRTLEAAPQSWAFSRLPARWRGLPSYSIGLRAFPKWEDFAATLPRSLRSNLRRRLKGLEAKGSVECGWCKTPDDAAAVLTWLFDNKRRWAQARGIHTGYLMGDQVRDFFIELAKRVDLPVNPLVAFVKMDGVPVAASINLVGPRLLEYVMTTYDEAYAPFSVGNTLLEFVVRWAHTNNLDFDFRPLYADYKATWSNRETWYESYLIVLGLRGRLAEFAVLGAQVARVYRKLWTLASDRLQSGGAQLKRSGKGAAPSAAPEG